MPAEPQFLEFVRANAERFRQWWQSNKSTLDLACMLHCPDRKDEVMAAFDELFGNKSVTFDRLSEELPRLLPERRDLAELLWLVASAVAGSQAITFVLTDEERRRLQPGSSPQNSVSKRMQLAIREAMLPECLRAV